MDAALAAWGLRRADDLQIGGAASFYIWPCNVRTWQRWNRLQTQWRVGFSGRTGLDYTAVTTYLRRVERVKRKDLAHIFMCFQEMEQAVLKACADSQQSTKG